MLLAICQRGKGGEGERKVEGGDLGRGGTVAVGCCACYGALWMICVKGGTGKETGGTVVVEEREER